MAEDDPFEPVYTYFFAWFGFTLAVFPLVATINSAVFDGSLQPTVVLGASIVVTIPAALEFLFSDRNPRLVGKFVGVFVGLFFVALVVQSVVFVALDQTETVPVVEFAFLVATYAVAYVLVYKGGLDRIRAAVGA